MSDTSNPMVAFSFRWRTNPTRRQLTLACRWRDDEVYYTLTEVLAWLASRRIRLPASPSKDSDCNELGNEPGWRVRRPIDPNRGLPVSYPTPPIDTSTRCSLAVPRPPI